MWLTKKETAEKAESVKTGVVTTGGAEIVLKLDGTVVINGQVFEKKEE